MCSERRRWWQAEYWSSGVRDQVLALACLRLGHPTSYGKGAHQQLDRSLPSSRQVPELAGQDHSPGSALAQQATRRRRALDLTVIFARRHDARRVEDGSVALAGAVTVPMRSMILALTCGSGWLRRLSP